jgi:hypothetical protein
MIADIDLIDGMSVGREGCTLSLLSRGENAYTKYKVKFEEDHTEVERYYKRWETRVDDKFKESLKKQLARASEILENCTHNIPFLTKDILSVKKKKDLRPIYVEDAEGKISPIYYYRPLKLMGTGDLKYPRIGKTFADLGLSPVHFYGPEDARYNEIKNKYVEKTK